LIKFLVYRAEPRREETKPIPPASRGIGAANWRPDPNLLQRRHLTSFLVYSALLLGAFIKPLYSLVIYAAHTELHSHILLVPFISACLIYIQRKQLPGRLSSSAGLAMIPLVSGLVILAAAFGLLGSFPPLSHNDSLALLVSSFLCLLVAGGFIFLGKNWMAACAFPVFFLVFIVPLPDGAVDWLETVSKLASAEAANLFFIISGTPVFRDSTLFQLPGITFEVAQECSGIRSSWVLFITSLLASHLCLQSPWRRVLLVAFVIPLGFLRNGFRILVIGLLCVHVGPQMFQSVIHKQGGPLFFVLSLVPLFLLLWLLKRGDTGSRSLQRGVA
jgi:exosortase C (VPDSG-CTERM-specific)